MTRYLIPKFYAQKRQGVFAYSSFEVNVKVTGSRWRIVVVNIVH